MEIGRTGGNTGDEGRGGNIRGEKGKIKDERRERDGDGER